jgi:hypothetical protein
MREREDGGAGSIAVSVAESNGLVCVQVTDDGIGLPREDRERLMEPYVTHKPKGTGLGLAIVKKIMEDHGGQVTLEDRPDGPGTVASLFLPITRDAGAGDTASTGNQPGAHQQAATQPAGMAQTETKQAGTAHTGMAQAGMAQAGMARAGTSQTETIQAGMARPGTQHGV